MLLQGTLPPKINIYGNVLPTIYLSGIFEFQLVPFAFSFVKVSPLPESMGRGDYFPNNGFNGGQVLWGKFLGGLFYMGGLMIRSYQGGRSFTKCIFQ